MTRNGSTRLIAAALVTLTVGAASPAAADTWPMFHRDARHTGLSSETGPSASDAASLGALWQANTGAGNRTSPAVAYNPVLGKTRPRRPSPTPRTTRCSTSRSRASPSRSR